MTDIWQNAPEGATHLIMHGEPCFYKKSIVVDHKWYFWDRINKAWIISDQNMNHSTLMPRPALDWYKSKELPPVGTECEFNLVTFWKPCTVKGEGLSYGRKVVFIQIGDDVKIVADADAFRPIKSEREKAIEEMARIFQSNCMYDYSEQPFLDGLGSLYDAGLRFTK